MLSGTGTPAQNGSLVRATALGPDEYKASCTVSEVLNPLGPVKVTLAVPPADTEGTIPQTFTHLILPLGQVSVTRNWEAEAPESPHRPQSRRFSIRMRLSPSVSWFLVQSPRKGLPPHLVNMASPQTMPTAQPI